LIERSPASFQGAFVINATKRWLKGQPWPSVCDLWSSVLGLKQLSKGEMTSKAKGQRTKTEVQNILSPDLNSRRVS